MLQDTYRIGNAGNNTVQ